MLLNSYFKQMKIDLRNMSKQNKIIRFISSILSRQPTKEEILGFPFIKVHQNVIWLKSEVID